MTDMSIPPHHAALNPDPRVLDHFSSALRLFVLLKAITLLLIGGAVNHPCALSAVIKLATASQRPV